MLYHTNFLLPWQKLTLWLLTIPLLIGIFICSYGWITTNVFLITLFPNAPLIHPITLFCFSLTLLAFWMMLLNFDRALLVISILLIIIASISLLENYFDLDSYINYPLTFFTPIRFEHLAYQCGISFFWLGIIFLILVKKKLRVLELITIPLICWIVLSFAQLSLVYYLFYKPGISILDNLTMSLPTTIGFLYIIMIMTFFMLCHIARLYPSDLTRWVITTLIFISMTGGYAVWSAAKKQEASFYRYLSRESVQIFKTTIEAYAKKRRSILENVLYFLNNPSPEYKVIWKHEVGIFQSQNPELFLVMGYVPNEQTFWESNLHGDQQLPERVSELLYANRYKDVIIDSSALKPKIIVNNRRFHPGGAWMAVVIDIETLMREMAGSIINHGEGLAILWNGHILFDSQKEDSYNREKYGASTTVSIVDPPLLIQAWPTEKLLTRISTPLSDLILAFSFSALVLIGIIFYYAEVARLKSMLYRRSEEEKTAFFANVSHEIRTQLQGIIGTGSVLEMTELTPKQQKMIHMIKASGSVLQRLLSDLLDITKVQMGSMKLNPAPTSLKDTLSDVVEIQSPKAHEKNLELNLRLDPHLPNVVVIDEARLEQILSNLIGNAIKFTMKGSITVTATTNFLQEPDKALLVIKVSDTGMGIAPKELKQIFNAFYQVRGPKNRAIVGTGLGLSISRTIAEYMGGTLTCQSIEGAGSTFTLMIPVDVKDTKEE